MKRSKNLLKKFIIAILSIFYIIAILFSWGYYPSLKLWKSIDRALLTAFPELTLFRVIHLVIGLPLFIYGMINVIEIVNINQKAQLKKNHPGYILKEGYYNKMRHPMYAMIILIQFSLFFSLCSLLGLLIGSLFTTTFMLFGLYEEKYQLRPIFGEEYKNYSNDVKIRYFPFPLKICLCFLYFFSFLGIFL